MLIKTLSWDSNFFDLKIGRVSSLDFDAHVFEREKNGFQLIYIEDASGNGHAVKEELRLNRFFEDRKILFSKHINGEAYLSEEIVLYERNAPNEGLVSLALQCGRFSRFRRDPNFHEDSYEKLYTKWIENSTNKEIAFCVLVYGGMERPEGFITLQRKGDDAHVGLFAVNGEDRNKGIGKKLLAAAEYYAKEQNYKTLSVATQADNAEACRLYEKCGFEIESTIHTYHYWNKQATLPS
jgi:dTDP-4-amino-4,6-dideoxy-D-galactose acyltransferase